MQFEEVRRLIRLVEESEIDELDVWRWWGRVRIRKTPVQGGLGVHPAAVGFGPVPAPAAAAPAPAPPAEAATPVDADAGLVPIKSPMVGTFYGAPAPDADPYVRSGDIIEPGQTLCIIEAMKLMNEIQSELRGKIVRMTADNGKPVEFGQTLFLVQPM